MHNALMMSTIKYGSDNPQFSIYFSFMARTTRLLRQEKLCLKSSVKMCNPSDTRYTTVE